MKKPDNKPSSIIIIGHKNPDTDSMVSAVAYTEFKKLIGIENVVAGCTGFPNARTDYLFKKFNVKLPDLITDVTPMLKDVMGNEQYTLKQGQVLLEAMDMFYENQKSRLPVIDDKYNFTGMISLFDLSSRLLVSSIDSENIGSVILRRKVKTTINLAAKTINAKTLSLHNENELEDLNVYVAALSLGSFRNHILEHSPDDIAVVVGDRDDIHFMAVELGVRLLIITGNAHINEGLLNLAKEKKTSILQTGLDSVTAVRQLKFSMPVEYMVQKNCVTYNHKDKITDVKHSIMTSNEDIFPVLNSKGKFKGTVSKNNMDDINNTKLILVDHNNMKQAVEGADEVPIIEILDHHHLDYPITTLPITVHNDVVGSTCTLVTEKFRYAGIKPKSEIAGILMGAIIDDTLFLKSPTTTERDSSAIKWLEEICKVSAEELASEIFNVGSVIANNPPEKVLTIDKKNYTLGKITFSIAQVEEANFSNFEDKFDELRNAAVKIQGSEKLDLFGLIVTNLPKGTSWMLAVARRPLLEIMKYEELKENLYDLPNILSRKKQLIPQLMKFFQPYSQ
ncbi:MAG TPA: putative manganese-dependent inorganic diphosphatase [Victivallales bacterium]|nr:putative manganese-dependent inorganic diphosphatase [Victivallales bacterium]